MAWGGGYLHKRSAPKCVSASMPCLYPHVCAQTCERRSRLHSHTSHDNAMHSKPPSRMRKGPAQSLCKIIPREPITYTHTYLSTNAHIITHISIYRICMQYVYILYVHTCSCISIYIYVYMYIYKHNTERALPSECPFQQLFSGLSAPASSSECAEREPNEAVEAVEVVEPRVL